VTHESNQLKAQFIEQGNNRKNQSPIVSGIINKIEKVLNNPKTFADKFQAYKDAYKVKLTTLAEENLKTMKAQQEKKKAEEEKAALQDKFLQEVVFAEYYAELAKGFMADNTLLQITIGDAKKMIVRCKADMVTGIPFSSLSEKKLWVIDTTKPIDKSNVKVVHSKTKKGLKLLLTEGTSLGKVALSLHKLQNSKEKIK
jgi:hypothetical protein